MAPKNIFISHIHEDDALIPRLKRLLDRQGVETRNYSVDSTKPNDATNPDYIKREILGPRIFWSSVMVVLVTPGTAQHWWVTWEIEHAARLGKPIVGVMTDGATESDVPAALDQLGDKLVPWKGEEVADAILDPEPAWEEPDGSPRAPTWDMQHYRC